MTNFLDELKKDLSVLTNRIEAWETTLEEDLKASKSDEECIVDEERVVAPVELLEDTPDCERGLERFGTRDRDIVHAPGNKRKRPEKHVPGTKDTILHQVKENATLGQRIEILDWYYANGRNQTKTAKHFDAVYPNLRIKQPLVSNWVKDESKWREEWENSHGSRHNAKRTRRIIPPESLSSSSSSPSIPTLSDPTDPIVKTGKSDETVKPINAIVLSMLPEGSGTMDSATTDNQISHAVMDPQEEHENGTEGVDDDNTTTRRPRPTRKEALQAALLLQRYLAATDDPFARKMEASLIIFIDQIRLIEARRNLKPTLLTDYFPRK